jgi:hypothetical protein
MRLWKNLKTLIQLLTCPLSQSSLKQGKRSSKFSSLSFRAWFILSMRFFHWIDAMLQPQPPARLRVPHALVCPDGLLPPVLSPQLLQEQIGVQDGLIVRDTERQEGLQSWLVGDPDPGLPPPDADHGLVHEDCPDNPPVHVEHVADGSQPLHSLPDGLVGPLHETRGSRIFDALLKLFEQR